MQHRSNGGKKWLANLINIWLESSFAEKVLVLLSTWKQNLDQQSALAVTKFNSILLSVQPQPTD